MKSRGNNRFSHGTESCGLSSPCFCFATTDNATVCFALPRLRITYSYTALLLSDIETGIHSLLLTSSSQTGGLKGKSGPLKQRYESICSRP